jgi:hypothetical protein
MTLDASRSDLIYWLALSWRAPSQALFSGGAVASDFFGTTRANLDLREQSKLQETCLFVSVSISICISISISVTVTVTVTVFFSYYHRPRLGRSVMGQPSVQASNAIIYLTYGAFLAYYDRLCSSVVGLYIAWRWRHQSKSDFLASNRTQKGETSIACTRGSKATVTLTCAFMIEAS